MERRSTRDTGQLGYDVDTLQAYECDIDEPPGHTHWHIGRSRERQDA
jgi:hypothetical protein